LDLLDGVLAVLVVLALLHGRKVGAVAQLVSFVGVLAGLAVGVALVVLVDPHVGGPTGKTLVALILLVVPASVLGGIGRHLGYKAWGALRHRPIARPADAAIGSVVAVAGTLVVCWLFASILVNSSIPSVSAAVGRSRIIRSVQALLPPVPDSFATVERYLSTTGFPQVLVNFIPEPVDPVTLPSARVVHEAVAGASASVLKVVALGCGEEQEGSSFAVARDLVVTNAHVIAGTTSISVLTRGGRTFAATPVYFDPKLDLALLRLPTSNLESLPLDQNFVARGADAVVLGYPNGGPFDAQPAGVVTRFDAQGRDIYDGPLTHRIVYELQADVQPGNSGGPLVTAGDEVVGVVFSRSATYKGIGYALASPEVRSAIELATAKDQHSVSTQSCTS
jgi:S1-C subfamily serine protease